MLRASLFDFAGPGVLMGDSANGALRPQDLNRLGQLFNGLPLQVSWEIGSMIVLIIAAALAQTGDIPDLLPY